MADKKDEKHSKSRPGMSRRGFFKGVGAGVITTSLVPPLLKAVPPPPVVGPGAVAMKLNINGRERSVTLEPRVTLLDALRNHLDLTGAKKVCDRATCGACTVIIDGRVVYACSVLAIEAQGHKIETVEGLSSGPQLHPVQAAFVANDAQQCGFCTPGFVMACKGFLDNNPNPTREQVLRGLGGNLCRCGTYVGVAQAILDAAAAKGGRANG